MPNPEGIGVNVLFYAAIAQARYFPCIPAAKFVSQHYESLFATNGTVPPAPTTSVGVAVDGASMLPSVAKEVAHGLESPPEVLAITDDVPPAPVTSAGAAVDGASLSPSAVGEVAHELEPPPAGLVASAGVPLAPATISGANADASRQLPMMFETTVDVTLVPATTGLGIASRTLPDHLIVYSRKPRRVETSSLAEEFLSKITKKVEALVPVPNIPKRRAKTPGPVSMPRRSRRIAKLPPETDTAAASIVCRKLGFANKEGLPLMLLNGMRNSTMIC